MPGTVSWNSLRELASFQAQQGCAVSLYLDLDPSVTPTAADFHPRVNSLVDALKEKADRQALSHSAREGLRTDVERIRSFLLQDLDRDGAHGLALFSAGLDNVWRPLPLADAVADGVSLGREFCIAPLVPLVGRGDGAIVAVAGREQGLLYRLRAGSLEEVADHTDGLAYSRHDQGGWSQARYQRHVDELSKEHLRKVAEELERHLRDSPGEKAIIVCPGEIRAMLDEMLSKDALAAVIGWAHAEAHASPAELLDVVRPLLEAHRAEEEREAVERWREEAGRGGRAASGWEQTLEAASDGRVELLLYEEGEQRSAWRCPQCGRAAAAGGSCPLDGTQMEEEENGLDLALHQTLGRGGTASALRSVQDLEPVGGIGALLRF